MFYSITSNLQYIPNVFSAYEYWFYQVYAWGRGGFQVKAEFLQLYKEYLFYSLLYMSYPVLKLTFQRLKFKQLFCLFSFPITHQQSKLAFQCPGVSYSKWHGVGKGFGSIAVKPQLTKWVGLGQDDDSPCGCAHVVWVFTNSVPASSAAALTQPASEDRVLGTSLVLTRDSGGGGKKEKNAQFYEDIS